MRARLAPLTALLLVACAPGGPTPSPSGTPYVLVTATPDPTPVPTPQPSPVTAQFGFSTFTASVDGKPVQITPQAFRSLEGDTENVLIGIQPGGALLPKGAYQLKLVLDGRGQSPVDPAFKESQLRGGFSLIVGNGTDAPDQFGSAENPEDKHFTLKPASVSLHFKGKVVPFLGGATHAVEVTITDFPIK
ncbi:MAG: hypothetical protein JWM80_4495 [Cyanobacteria bacterium RYN_339]|nr:hypothetical protein [Cyanobacteria bacterium RYN_339]